ncbi:Tetratricopeptide repeat-containing protein [Lishizhenia tianjinensis]|uniref:Tetratricopeptide repeat-containing protein n=1 Tax=Lishizhenia tianjinensis TaxID=477690 RepID=A0A1I7BF11_9FLAO|nr:tetratricopeptide repeat protein [Lishizhenia tianjinensis]SFT85702.1 Tetratricopeptide repeat-containing protein [Lishizhenia tianjinensis]
MRYRILFLLALVVGLNFSMWAQQTEAYRSDYALFYSAEELFEKQQYSAARKSFHDFILSFSDHSNDPFYIKARYYEGLSALELFNNDAVDLLIQFNTDYPESIYKNNIYFKLGNYFYQKKKYPESIEWYEKTKVNDIAEDDKDAYYFKLGYACFQEGKFEQSRNAFYEIKDGVTQYAHPALYYYSHIAYQKEQYQVALEGFEKLKEDESFAALVPYYITQIYYLQGKYDKVTELAPEIGSNENYKDKGDLNHLIGDAYYKVEQYDEAIPYLEKYNESAQTTREDDYQLAYAYYRAGNYSKASKKFERVARTDDELGQTAMYHAGECYLKLENLDFARTAFFKASELDFNETIQEDALYNSAILSYKLDYNPYSQAIVAFETYLNKYPNSKRKNDVYQYLVNVYSNTKNYQAALTSLENLPSLNIKLKSAYQIIAFNRGLELLEQRAYPEAIATFKKVGNYPINADILGESVYWTGEAYYLQGKNQQAILEYRNFLSIPGNYTSNLKQDAYYNIGYAYFNEQDYDQALVAFRTYTGLGNIANKNKLADAYARIGDATYYIGGRENYKLAVQNYEASIQLGQGAEDKSRFYQAKAYSWLNDRENAVKSLLDIVNNYKNSVYTVRAVYDISIAYYRSKNYKDAVRYAEQLARDYPSNLLVKDALLLIGDIKFKQEEYSASESYFKRVLNEYSARDTSVCKPATKGLVAIYEQLSQIEKIRNLRIEYPCAEISDDAEEEIYYKNGVIAYNESRYEDAIPGLSGYIQNFPQGKYAVEIRNYLADSYYSIDSMRLAMEVYDDIINDSYSSYTELALIRASKYYYNSKDYESALPYYVKLENIASTPEVIYNTRIGLMRTNYLLENYENAIVAGLKVMQDKQVSDDIEKQAYYIVGLSSFQVEEYDEALVYLKWLSKNAGDARGSEAQYTIAKIYFLQGEYEKSTAEHKALLKRKPAYDYWIAKSLLLHANVLMATDELFQAKSTVDVILQNYPNQEDGILDEAAAIAAEIEQLQNTPKQIEEGGVETIEINDEGGNDE